MSVAWIWNALRSHVYGGKKRAPLTREQEGDLLRRDCLANPIDKIERARFVGTYGRDEPLMNLASLARSASKAVSLAHWLHLAADYPDHGLPANAVATKHPEAKVRAYFLFKSIIRLLKFVDAPPQMSRDLKVLLLDPNKLRAANGRARLQKELLRGGTQGVRPLGRKAIYSYSEIKKDIEKGFVVVPPPDRSDPAST